MLEETESRCIFYALTQKSENKELKLTLTYEGVMEFNILFQKLKYWLPFHQFTNVTIFQVVIHNF